jgi:putative tricarboxylic transport membrane protein
MDRPGRSRFTAHQDAVAGLILLGFCALAYWLTTRFAQVPAMLSQNVPPTFFPRLVLGLIALLSVILIARGLKRSAEPKPRLRPAVFVTAAVIILATALVRPLGTLATLFLVTFVLPLTWKERRLGIIAVLAIALPAAVYVVFTLALGVRFPPGLVASLLG